MNKQHVHYFDPLRLIAAISVIYIHTSADLRMGAIQADWHLSNIFAGLSFTAVSLFFMMSGYLILSSEKTADVSYLLKKRLPHLLIPLVGWTVLVALWYPMVTDGFSVQGIYNYLIRSLHTPAWVHFWYLYTLIALYLISPILYGGIRALDKKGHIFVFVIICAISLKSMLQAVLPENLQVFLQIDLLNKLSIFDGAVALFILGYYLGKTPKHISNTLLALIAGGTLVIIVLGTYLATLKNGVYYDAFLKQTSGFEVILSACIFLLFKQNCNKPLGFFKTVPFVPLSLSIYLMHGIFLAMLIPKMPIDSFVDTVWVTCLVFVACYLVMKTAATIKPICYLATGMTYENACNSCNWIYTYRKLTARKEDL